MQQAIQIEDYTLKSFVVRGETREYKDTLKSLGGKWNSSLTDKQTGEKFGAWLFWNDNRDKVEKWFSNGCSKIVEESSVFKIKQNIEDDKSDFSKMLKSIEKIEKHIEKIDNDVKIILNYIQKDNTCILSKSDNLEEYEDSEPGPMRRLLKK